MWRSILVALLVSFLSGCGDSDPDALAISWSGDYVQPQQAALLGPDGGDGFAGPAELEYEIVRFSPDGNNVAAVTYGGSSAQRAVHVFPLVGRSGLTILEGTEPLQDLSFSPDGDRLALIGTDWVTIYENAEGPPNDWQRVGERIEMAGRLFAPLDGDPWAPDGGFAGLATTSGVLVVFPDASWTELEFDGAPFSASAAAFAGWLDEDEILVLDQASGVYYSRSPDIEAPWRATVAADPRAAFTEAIDRGAAALFAELPGASIALARVSTDRQGVVVVGYSTGDGAELTQGPFRVAVALVPAQGDPYVFEFGEVASLGAARDGRLVDAVLR